MSPEPEGRRQGDDLRSPSSALDTLRDTARTVLAGTPHAVVRYRLLRDVLREKGAALCAAKFALNGSPHVKALRASQHPDGGWGGLHGATEHAVERALVLGLDATDPMVRRAADYVASLLLGRRPFPEMERNERAQHGWRMFAAATLVQVDPTHPALKEDRGLWLAICRRSFASGEFDPEAELRAHASLTGIREIGYLQLRNKYAATIIGAYADELPPEIERSYVRWLWEHPRGLGYLDTPVNAPPPLNRRFGIHAWFRGTTILSRFPCFRPTARQAAKWLWGLRGQDGLWDLGSRSTCDGQLPFSPNWRKPCARRQDWSTRAMCLLALLEGNGD